MAAAPTTPTRLSLSNTALAERLGVHLTMASRLRSGQRRPSIQLATHLLESLEIPERLWPEAMRSFSASGRQQAEFFASVLEWPPGSHQS